MYSTNAANSPFYFVGHYYDAEDNIPQWVQELYGYTFAERIDEINKRLTELGEADEALQADNQAHHAIRFGGIVDGDIIIEQVGLSNPDYTYSNSYCASVRSITMHGRASQTMLT